MPSFIVKFPTSFYFLFVLLSLTTITFVQAIPTTSTEATLRQPHERHFQIHPGYDETKCLDVRGSDYRDGTPVDMYVLPSCPSRCQRDYSYVYVVL